MEFRIKNVDISCSKEDMTIGGYINVTHRDSEVMYSKKRNKWFKEVIVQNAFKRSLDQNSSIPLLLEHDFNSELAHTDRGTFFVEEDQIGLKFSAKLEDRSVYEKIQKGLINNCSFGFRVVEEEFETINTKLERRFINSLVLVECSLVSNPAYLGSLVETRELEDALKTELEHESKEEMVEEKMEKILMDDSDIKDTHINSESGQSIIDNSQAETETIEEENKEVVAKSTDNRAMVEDEVVDVEVLMDESQTDNIIAHDEMLQQVDTTEIATTTVEEVTNIVEDVIEQKEEELQVLQAMEEGIAEYIEDVKEENKQMEENLESEAIRLSTDVLRLRLELLKLKTIKKELA